MVKSYKFLMLLLLATFTLGFTACTDEPENEYELKTVTLDIFEEETQVYKSENLYLSGSDYIYIHDHFCNMYSVGCKMAENGSKELADVTTAPYQDYAYKSKLAYSPYRTYAIKTSDGKYFKMRVFIDKEITQVTFTYQRYDPENIK